MNYSAALNYIKDEAQQATGLRPTTTQVRDAARESWIYEGVNFPTSGQITEAIEVNPEAVLGLLF